MRSLVNIASALLLGVVLTGCADRLALPFTEKNTAVAKLSEILVATTRGTEPNGRFTRERVEKLAYFDTTVSIPLNRQTGKLPIEFLTPDPARDFAFTNIKKIENEKSFRAALREKLRASPGENEAVLYVHGYNNSFSDGVFRIAQLKEDLNIPGVPLHFSWSSAVNPLGYAYDQDSMLFARDGLEQTLRDGVATAGKGKLLIIGHSMGTLLVMETLRQIEIQEPGWARRNLAGVLLISPDIDTDLFRMIAGKIKELPDPFIIFVSQRDRALALSRRLNGSRSRLGSLKDPSEIADLDVTLVDVSQFRSGNSHFAAATSPTLIALLNNIAELDAAFQSDRAGRTGLVQGTVLSVQNVTQVILSPALLLEQ